MSRSSNPGGLICIDPNRPDWTVPFQWRPGGVRAGGQAQVTSVERDRAAARSMPAGVDLHTMPLDVLWDSRRHIGKWAGPTLDDLRARLHRLTIPVGGPDSGADKPVVRYVPWGTGLDWTVTADWAAARIVHRPEDGAILAIRITLTLTQHRPLQATASYATTATADAPAGAAATGGTAGTERVVAAGESLSTIAADVYDDAGLWKLLWEANKDRLRSGDPDLIYAGEVLIIPPKP